MKNKIYCVNCGEKIEEYSNYCISCGAKNLYHMDNDENFEEKIKVKKYADKK